MDIRNMSEQSKGNKKPKKTTRIQRKNRVIILDAALEVFSTHGFRGSTLDMIADEAKISKPNLIYYYNSKEAIYQALLMQLLDNWVDPLININADGEPIEQLLNYLDAKLDMSRDFPRESRLFAGEIIRGAPLLKEYLRHDLKELVEQKAEVIRIWISEGKLAEFDPYHFLFSMWSISQHYADFEVQVEALMGVSRQENIERARAFQHQMYRKLLTP